ncbi:cytochrome c biogenesis protein ResB [Aureivirga marina]|uniref:cytochrome c biogenesis protein ResB n=1 Tax=Aureivirga marina TaxID=1182451 RepID=UPI0018C98117|nr:cytochrome c biogenesis protein ResB [Aureivirga marina]
MKPDREKRMLWENPWGYTESFIIGIGLLLTGFALEMFVGRQSAFELVFPYNLYIFLGFNLILVILYKWFSKNQIVRWLLKVPASITSIVLVTFMVLLMGIFPQINSTNALVNTLGLNHITTHWAFLLIIIFFLTCLGLVTIKRIAQLKWKNFGFVLNHLGLYLALFAGIVGSGDLQRLSLDTYEGSPSIHALDMNNQKVELPFAIYLKDFKIEEYNPKLALVDNEKGELVHNNGKNLYLIDSGKVYNFEEYHVRILKFLESSGRIENGYAFVNEQGSPPSAEIEVINTKTKDTVKGWISSGSFRHPFESLKIDAKYSMVMTIPEAKKFSSDISILNIDGSRIETTLEVNKPYSYKGYKLYQLSYDDAMGKWSTLSVIELVRDPWLPVIYTGVFMMIAGAVYMFWMGNKFKKETK